MILANHQNSNNIAYTITTDDEPSATQEEDYNYKTCISDMKNKDARAWTITLINSSCLVSLLYSFLFFLELMGNSFKVLGGCNTGELFTSLDNPILGLMTGIVSTVLLQSSSSSTSIVVSLVGSDSMSVRTAIPVVMGANIGTSVTNTIVSFGQIVDSSQFERAFAGATVHDMFNYLSVLLLLPIELIFHPLENLSDLLKPSDLEDGNKWEGPVKKIVSPFVKRILNVNKDAIKNIANNKVTCNDIYNVTNYEYGLIQCSDLNDDGNVV